MASEQAGRTYHLEPLDTSGVFLGLTVIQCGLVGGGVTVAVVMVTARLPLWAAAFPVVAATGASFGRVGRRSAWEWLPLGVGWMWAGLARGRRWRAPLPLWPTESDKPPPLPPCLAGLEVIEIPWRQNHTLGAVGDRQHQTLTAIVPVRGTEFVLQPTGEQDRLVAGWGDVLAQLAAERGAVAHVSWSELARPSRMEDHRSWLAHRDAGGPPDAGYDELVDVAADRAVSHDIVISVTVARDRLGRRDDGDDPLALALVATTEALIRGCRAAGLIADHPLAATGVHRLLRTRVDPIARAARSGRLAERLGLVPAAAGPLALEVAWDHVRIDGAWHRTYWVAGWPRLGVPSAWLEPFLSAGGVTRAMTIVFVPVPHYQSRRRIQRDLVKLESDAVTKEDKGRRVDARHQRATQALLDREQELVAGYVEMAYIGLITVSAGTQDDLDGDTAIVEQLAREASIDLRPLDGRHDLAWAAALPFGLAPKALLAT
jgi:hypothetical protein